MPTRIAESDVEDDSEPGEPRMSRLALALNALGLSLLLGGGGVFLWLMASLPTIEGEVTLAGLDLPVSVTRDARGVPHIAARNQADAYMALGFVHAQDRFWQMEVQRRAGTGRLAEIVGDKALGSDRYLRTLGIGTLAEASAAAVDAPTKEALDAYAKGVNAWIATHRHRLPPEFRLLGYQPEPWKPADSLIWARLMALQLTGNWRDDATRGALAALLPPEHLNQLYPGHPASAPVTLSAAATAAFLADLPEIMRPRTASNVWAVEGERTASGKPLLANDPHLGLQAPILWYLAVIEAPGLFVAGATVPGVPFHLIAHNRRIAWGTTTTHADTVDLVVEPEAAAKIVRTETIRVKDAPDVHLDVRETANGPVVSDMIARDLAGPGQVVAFKATALLADDRTSQAMYRVNRAWNWSSFVDSMAGFHAPVMNFAYADVEGSIGFLVAGRVPIRAAGDGSLPVKGGTAKAQWKGWIPWREMPRVLNPPSGFIANGNNKVTGPDYPYLISALWPEPHRILRLNEVLGAARGLTFDAMARLQQDVHSPAVREILDAVPPLGAASDRQRRMLAWLQAWDGSSAKEKPEPLLFWTWIEHLHQALFADELGAAFKGYGAIHPGVLAATLTRDQHWCDDVRTPEKEGCETIILGALDAALAEIEARHGPDPSGWAWGDEHVLRLDHPILGKLAGLSALVNIVRPGDGDDFTLNRGTYARGGDGPAFRQVVGAGLRVVFDLADLDQSRFIIASGQSGNPLSFHYADLADDWQANRGHPLGERHKRGAVLKLMPAE